MPKEYLLNEEIEKIRKKHEQNLSLSCDEYHAHSSFCLYGPTVSMDIIQLIETIDVMKSIIAKAQLSLLREPCSYIENK